MSLSRIFALYLTFVSAALVAGSSCATGVGPSAKAATTAIDPAAPRAPIVWPTEILESSAAPGRDAPDAGPRDASPHDHHHHHHGAPHAN